MTITICTLLVMSLTIMNLEELKDQKRRKEEEEI